MDAPVRERSAQKRRVSDCQDIATGVGDVGVDRTIAIASPLTFAPRRVGAHART